MRTVQALNTSSTPLHDVITVTTADGTSHQVDVTINGANDAAVITGVDTGSVTEASGVLNGTAGVATATGEPDATDVDSSAAFNLQSNAATSYGHFTIDASGNWSYALDDNNADGPGAQHVEYAAARCDHGYDRGRHQPPGRRHDQRRE